MLRFHDPLAAARSARARLSRGTIRVSEGAQQGASHALGPDMLSIGAGLDNDIVLLADGLDEAHARIGLTGLLGRTLRVEATGRPVTVETVGTVEPGYGVDVALPATLVLDGACLDVSAAPLMLRVTAPRAALGALAVLGVLTVLASPWSSSRALPLAASAPVAADAVSRLADIARPDGAASAEARLKRLLADAGLAEQVTVRTTAPGEVTLSGRIDRSAAPAWRTIVMQLDASPDQASVLNTVEVVDAPVKPPQVRSVWFGTTPKVMMADGRYLAAGEATTDGWTVDRIEPGSVVLKSDNHAPVRIAF